MHCILNGSLPHQWRLGHCQAGRGVRRRLRTHLLVLRLPPLPPPLAPQAVAAMAWGTASCPKVDKILGPGNQFVTAAKMLLQVREG